MEQKDRSAVSYGLRSNSIAYLENKVKKMLEPPKVEVEGKAAELHEKFGDQKEKDGDLSTSPRSLFCLDHSPNGKASENGECRNELQKEEESVRQELEAENDQVTDFQPEVDSLLTHKGVLGPQIEIKNHEAQRFREENQVVQLMTRELDDRISVRVLLKVQHEMSSLLKKLEDSKNEESLQFMASTAQVKDVQELGSSHSQKIPSEPQVAGERQEATGRQTQENKNMEIDRKLFDMQKLLKKHEDKVSKLTKEYKQLEDLNQESLNYSQEMDRNIKHKEQLYLRDIAVEDEMIEFFRREPERENRKVRFRKEIITELRTRLEKMKAKHKDLQERHKTELEKAVAMVERQCQTIKLLRGIQEENRGHSEKEDKVLSFEQENKK